MGRPLSRTVGSGDRLPHTMKDSKAPGEQYIVAQSEFDAKHADNPALVAEVKNLTNLLQMWHLHVMMALWNELIRKGINERKT